MENSLSRADFLAASASKQKVVNPAFVLQFKENSLGIVRTGFTVTKKHGNAIARNRIKRRLREMVRLARKDTELPAGDYVFIARHDALNAEFTALQSFARQALSRIHKPKPLV